MALATITLSIRAILAILVGILIISKPKLIRWALGLYLILIGILGLVDFAFI
ncbi:MAG: DUF3096 domain-containing protein [archaeon]